MGLTSITSRTNRWAKVTGIVGSIWGLALTLFQTVTILPEQSRGLDGPWPVIRFAIVGLVLYGASLFCVVRGYRRILVFILIVLIPLNVIALASVGFLLVPGTALLIVATALLWRAAGDSGNNP